MTWLAAAQVLSAAAAAIAAVLPRSLWALAAQPQARVLQVVVLVQHGQVAQVGAEVV